MGVTGGPGLVYRPREALSITGRVEWTRGEGVVGKFKRAWGRIGQDSSRERLSRCLLACEILTQKGPSLFSFESRSPRCRKIIGQMTRRRPRVGRPKNHLVALRGFPFLQAVWTGIYQGGRYLGRK